MFSSNPLSVLPMGSATGEGDGDSSLKVGVEDMRKACRQYSVMVYPRLNQIGEAQVYDDNVLQ